MLVTMKQYHDMIKRVRDEGAETSDRTGTGTTSVFGHQTRFNLQEGFPLVTTKRVPFKSVVAELEWFLSGNTNNNRLRDLGATIWDEWANPDGGLGPIYGAMWRRWPVGRPDTTYVDDLSHLEDDTDLPDRPLIKTEDNPTPHTPKTTRLHAGLVVTEEEKVVNKDEIELWTKLYSNRGLNITICERWYDLKAFVEDLSQTPGYEIWKANQNDYVLSLNYHNATYYGPGTCIFIPKKYDSQLSRCIAHPNHDPMLTPKRKLFRKKLYIDQLADVLHTLKTNPTSRRMVVSGWNPSELPLESRDIAANIDLGAQALPPCHTLFQFNTRELTEREKFKYGNDVKRVLNCQLYMRSNDVPLGAPFNIASYALLTALMAHEVGMVAGDLVYTVGDLHVYNNQSDIYKILERELLSLPTLKIKDTFESILTFKADQIELVGYEHHASIPLPVSK